MWKLVVRQADPRIFDRDGLETVVLDPLLFWPEYQTEKSIPHSNNIE